MANSTPFASKRVFLRERSTASAVRLGHALDRWLATDELEDSTRMAAAIVH
jgi:hypothetical protein